MHLAVEVALKIDRDGASMDAEAIADAAVDSFLDADKDMARARELLDLSEAGAQAPPRYLQKLLV